MARRIFGVDRASVFFWSARSGILIFVRDRIRRQRWFSIMDTDTDTLSQRLLLQKIWLKPSDNRTFDTNNSSQNLITVKKLWDIPRQNESKGFYRVKLNSMKIGSKWTFPLIPIVSILIFLPMNEWVHKPEFLHFQWHGWLLVRQLQLYYHVYESFMKESTMPAR